MPRRPGTSSTINAACTASTGGLNTVRSATGSAVPLSAEVGATAAGELLGTVVCWDPGSWGRARGSSWGSDGGKVDKESDCWLWGLEEPTAAAFLEKPGAEAPLDDGIGEEVCGEIDEWVDTSQLGIGREGVVNDGQERDGHSGRVREGHSAHGPCAEVSRHVCDVEDCLP
eukprot:7076929-Pyramimonas_sp.AAC.1